MLIIGYGCKNDDGWISSIHDVFGMVMLAMMMVMMLGMSSFFINEFQEEWPWTCLDISIEFLTYCWGHLKDVELAPIVH